MLLIKLLTLEGKLGKAKTVLLGSVEELKFFNLLSLIFVFYSLSLLFRANASVCSSFVLQSCLQLYIYKNNNFHNINAQYSYN